ncbi:MAG: enoyl-CoA hydratase/isomerase family protein [Ornithinimicrobium sp.]
MTTRTAVDESTSPEPTLQTRTESGVGVVVLNRPRALNALDDRMITGMHRALDSWRVDDAVNGIWVCAAGEKGLCAGGDIRAVREAVRDGRADSAMTFFGQEYALNALVAHYPKPYVVWMDGVVMGGGVGISGHGSHRLVTERTRIAMPETIIGFFPDVGALWLLSRAPGETGTHLALSGATVGGADAVFLGLADIVVSSGSRDEVYSDLLRAADRDGAGLASWTPGPRHRLDPSEPELAHQRGWIDECYAGSDITTILGRLRRCSDPAGSAAADAIEARSPHSVALTLEALRRARAMSVEEVLAQDLTLARSVIAHPDFDEGVRAQLVDKDRAPRWSWDHVSQVTRREVLSAFA